MGKATTRRKERRRQFLERLAQDNPERFELEWAKRIESWADEIWRIAKTFNMLAEAALRWPRPMCLTKRDIHACPDVAQGRRVTTTRKNEQAKYPCVVQGYQYGKEGNDMSKKVWVDRNHYRVTSNDGRRSYLYESDDWFSHCVEVAEHHRDCTTDAYEADNSFIGTLIWGGKGKHK